VLSIINDAPCQASIRGFLDGIDCIADYPLVLVSGNPISANPAELPLDSGRKETWNHHVACHFGHPDVYYQLILLRRHHLSAPRSFRLFICPTWVVCSQLVCMCRAS